MTTPKSQASRKPQDTEQDAHRYSLESMLFYARTLEEREDAGRRCVSFARRQVPLFDDDITSPKLFLTLIGGTDPNANGGIPVTAGSVEYQAIAAYIEHGYVNPMGLISVQEDDVDTSFSHDEGDPKEVTLSFLEYALRRGCVALAVALAEAGADLAAPVTTKTQWDPVDMPSDLFSAAQFLSGSDEVGPLLKAEMTRVLLSRIVAPTLETSAPAHAASPRRRV